MPHRIGGYDVAMFRASNRVHQEITIVKFSFLRAVSTFAFGGPKGDGDTLVCLKNLHRIMHCSQQTSLCGIVTRLFFYIQRGICVNEANIGRTTGRCSHECASGSLESLERIDARQKKH